MTITNIIVLLLFSVSNTWSHGQADIESTDLNEGNYGILNNIDVFSKKFKNILGEEKIRIDIYYEVFCPHCITFAIKQLAPVVNTMISYVDIKTYPFGNAKIIEDNGKVTFECQHGPTECYGNKLHACALDNLEHTKALQFNICLMNSTDGQGSDDKSADRCGKSMNVDAEKIKACAKGARGIELLKFYGEKSKKAGIQYVPLIVFKIGVFIGNDLKQAICELLRKPPPTCNSA